MSREILFKGKRIDNGKWITGDYLFYSIQAFIIERGSLDKVKIKRDTVCQYTGLSAFYENENGEDVEAPLWEHDLLEIKFDGQTILAEVTYEGGGFILVSNDFVDGYIPLMDIVECEDTLWVRGKVVGNVFDNPELLDKNYECTERFEISFMESKKNLLDKTIENYSISIDSLKSHAFDIKGYIKDVAKENNIPSCDVFVQVTYEQDGEYVDSDEIYFKYDDETKNVESEMDLEDDRDM